MEYSKEEAKSKWEHIASIFKEYTTPSRVLRSLTNLSNTVIQTALSGQCKFVFEILQNADDAFEDEFQAIEVQFILQNNYLIVNHNGKGFNFNDVERICDYASQIEEVKATDLSKTGYKGLGFKSLFNLSDCIYIYSNGYSFRFDKTHWPDSQSKPWQIIPIWCSCNELPLNEKYSYDQPVNFILQVNDISQIESQLKELVDQPELLLYLHRINKLDITLNGQKHSLERKVKNLDIFNKVDFYKNQLLASTWLSRTYKLSVPTEIQTFVQGASRFVYPNKIQKAKEAIFTFTVQCDEDLKEISKIKGLCYSTLPTQLHLALPYHINSLFILNLDRTQLHENEWNEFLIYEIGHLQLSLLKDLAGMIYLKNYVVELLVRNIDHLYTTFNKAFFKGFIEGKSEIGWLPAHQGSRLLKLGEAWTDETDFFKQNFQNIRDHKIYPYLINYDIRNQYDLFFSEGEAKRFTYLQLFRDFPDIYYPQLTKDSYINFITYLYERLNGFSAKTTVMVKLKDVPFLIAKDRTLLSPRNASLEESENPAPDFLMLTLVDNEYLPSNNAHLMKEWLELLGARWLKTPIQIIRESILEWIDSGQLGLKITMKNHIEIINYLAKNVDQLTKTETEKLKERLLVLTKSNKFKSAKFCYLPDAVSIKELSGVISNDEKISSCYDMDSLRGFFIHIGVHDKLNPIDILRKSILMWIKNGEINYKLTKSNYNSIIEFVASHYPTMECNLTASEKRELKKIPVLTRGDSFQKAEVCYLDSAILNIQGIENIIAEDKLISTKNTSENVINFLKKIGVSKKIAPLDVIQRSILMWITNGTINSELTKSNYNSIIDFVAFHYPIIERDLTEAEKIEFKKMPVLTCSELFQKAEACYLDSAILNIKGFEHIIKKDELVSTDNISENVIKFLIKVGVSKEIASLDVMQRTIFRWITNDKIINDEVTKSSYNPIIEFVASHYPTIKHDLTPSEKTQLKQMPVLTYDGLFHKAEVCYLDSATLNIKGFEHIIEKDELVSTDNISENVIKFLTKVGVSKEIAPLDVMQRTIFRWIANDKIINDEATKSSYNSIIEFVASHYPTMKHNLTASEKTQLKKMPILTYDKLFQKAEVCYLDSAIHNIKGFEHIITKDELVSTDNISENVIQFLTKVGVSKEIAPADVIRRTIFKWITNDYIIDEVTKSSYNSIIEFVASHYPTIERDLTETEKIEFEKMPVLTCDELFQKADVCYLDSATLNIKGFEHIIAKDKLVSTDNISENVINFLTKIGVSKEIAPVDVIRRTIFKWITNDYIIDEATKSSYNSIIEFVASHYPTMKHNLTASEKTQLKKMPVLTYDKLFQKAEVCYLDSAIHNIKGFEHIITKDELVSTDNISENVINFLTKVGVSKEIAPVDVIRRTIFKWITNDYIIDEVTKSGYNSIIEFVASHYPTIERDLTEAEKIELKKMPVLTCDELFHKAEVCYMDTAVLDIKGFECVIAKNELVSTENISENVINFLTKFGVSKVIAPLDVIKRSVFRWIQDGNIEEKITVDNHHDIIKYIAKQWVTFRSLWEMKPEVKHNLKQIPILTKRDTFRAVCICYRTASNSNDSNYEEIPGLEDIIPSDEHVSTVYQSMEIKTLLKDLGVHNLNFANIYEKYSDHLTQRENVKWFFSKLIHSWEKNKASSNKNKMFTYLQQKFKSSSRLLAKNGKMYYSINLYSSQYDIMHNVDPNAIPLLDYEKLPEDFEKYLGFKMDLDLKCIVELLEAIHKKPKLGEKETWSFFTILLEQLRQKDKNEIKKYQLSLFSKDNKLRAANDLYYFIEEDATCVLDSCYLKRIHNMSHDETLELAELCGVNTLPFEQKVDREKEIYDNTLKEFYLERLPLIVVQESRELNESPGITLKRLYDKVCTIMLYQCHNIYVKYPFGNTTEIRRHFDNLTLYVVDKWTSWKYKSEIHSHVKKRLGLKTNIKQIIDMEPITERDKQDWLNDRKEDPQEFYGIEKELQKLLSNQEKEFALTPYENAKIDQPPIFRDEEKHFRGNKFSENEKRTSSESSSDESSKESVDEFCLETENTIKNEPETTYKKMNDLWDEADINRLVPNESDIGRRKRIHQPEMHGIHYSTTKSLRTEPYKFPQKVSDKKPHMKRLSEKCVFNFFQEHYKKKYPNSQFNVLGGLFKLKWQSHKIEIVWINESEEKGHPYDLLLNRGSDIKQLFEVKSSNDELTSFESSSHESSKESTNEFCLETQYAIKNEPETIASYKKINYSWDEDIMEDGRRYFVPNESDTDLKKRINQSEIHGIHYSSTKSRHIETYQFSQEVSDKIPHIKRLSERCVFDFLQEHYKKKYPNSQFNLLDGLFKLHWQSHKIEIFWLNENEDKGHPYDLLLYKDGEIKQVIEVKSSNDVANEDSFNMSLNEFIKNMTQLATELPQHTEKYCIYRVFNAENPLVRSVEGLNIPSLFKIMPLNNPEI